MQRRKSDVRQGVTNRGSASIADLIVVKEQRLQGLVLAANQTRTHLDNAPYHPTNSGGAKEMSFWMKVLSQGESNVRQGTTDRSSASIANLVVTEAQYLQCLVLAANQTQTHLDNVPLSIRKKIGWRRRNVFMNESSFKR